MVYYLLTQGTRSNEYSFIVNNGNVIDSRDKSRNEIIETFQTVDKKAKTINKENSEIKFKKFRDNYLIEVLTKNTDRLGRKIPVELLLVNYQNNIYIEKELSNINSILKLQNINLDEDGWLSIPLQLKECIDRNNEKRRRKYLIGASIALVFSSIIIILLLTKQNK